MATMLTDSGVCPGDDSYSSATVWEDWEPENRHRLCQIKIVVHRRLEESTATASVWAGEYGWVEVLALSPDLWWDDVPGYRRWAQDKARTKLNQLSDDLITQVAKLAHAGGLL